MENSILNSAARITLALASISVVSLVLQNAAYAQRGGQAGGSTQSAEAGAPIDLTGYWESIVTSDWAYRMVTPRPGDFSDIPLKPAGERIMDAWDPAKDTAAGEQCKSYGAPTIMSVPGHLHITWQDEQTLKMETDAGQQTRLFHFGSSAAAAHDPRSLQGYSVAQWELQGQRGRSKPAWGAMKVTTGNLKEGYLRKNGIPYSQDAKLVEYYDLLEEKNANHGDQPYQLMVVSTHVTDPVYLYVTYVTDENFLKLPSDEGWEPSACSAIW